MITLQETNDSYLLMIPYYQRSRAKAIPGRQWDGSRKCWIYPRTLETYDALITEFGDELRGVIPGRPVDVKNVDIMALLQNLLSTAPSPAEEEESLAESRIVELENSIQEMSVEREKLKAEVLKLTSLLNSNTSPNLFALAGELAAAAAGEASLVSDAERLQETSSIIVEFAKDLERRLCDVLPTGQQMKLYDLLEEAKRKNILSDEGYGHAQTLRKIRNIAAHGNSDPNTESLRSLIALFATALIRRELSRFKPRD